jgi:hypothetical protein
VKEKKKIHRLYTQAQVSPPGMIVDTESWGLQNFQDWIKEMAAKVVRGLVDIRVDQGKCREGGEADGEDRGDN